MALGLRSIAKPSAIGCLTADLSRAKNSVNPTLPKTLCWIGELPGFLQLIDQTQLPQSCVYLECHTVEQVWQAIRSLSVRGAPAIGCAAAYGVLVGIQSYADQPRAAFNQRFEDVLKYLATSRPTAVNLFWALERMLRVAEEHPDMATPQLLERLLAEARLLEEEDRAMCAAIGQHGMTLMPQAGGVLTHCNAGGLATAGDGTALAVLFAAALAGKQLHVFADETRPLLQGARLTAWELQQRGIPVTVVCDSMAALLMRDRKVSAVIVGADRITANGDVANKVGTYSVAVLARAHGIPFYVAAPSSTFDLSLASGSQIPIEERHRSEIAHSFGTQTVPHGVAVWNPAFDVTPAELIAGIVTEHGIVAPVNESEIRRVLRQTPQSLSARPQFLADNGLSGPSNIGAGRS